MGSDDAALRVDRDLVANAIRKIANREELSRSERHALQRHERYKEEQLRWRYYRTIPQKHWRQMSGRQAKVINEQAQRYGIPCGGPKVDLTEVVKALHDFLADNAIKLARDDDPMLLGGNSPALERYREHRAELARLDVLERQRQLLPRERVRLELARIAAILRTAGETLQRDFGDGAAEVLFEALDDAEREISRAFDEEPADGSDASDAA